MEREQALESLRTPAPPHTDGPAGESAPPEQPSPLGADSLTSAQEANSTQAMVTSPPPDPPPLAGHGDPPPLVGHEGDGDDLEREHTVSGIPSMGAACSAPEPSAATMAPPWARSIRGLGMGLLVIGLAQLPLMLLTPHEATTVRAQATEVAAPLPLPPSSMASAASANAASGLTREGATTTTSSVGSPTFPTWSPPRPPRVFDLEDAHVEILRTRVGKRTCARVLTELGLAVADVGRITSALNAAKPPVRCNPGDLLFVAHARPDELTARRTAPAAAAKSAAATPFITPFVALELEHAPGDLLRVRPSSLPGFGADSQVPPPDLADARSTSAATPPLIVEHLELAVEHRRMLAGFVVRSDLPSTLVAEKLDPSLASVLAEVVATRHDLPAIAAGSTLKLVLDATYVGGHFDRWDQVVAMEYVPRPGTPAVRLYHGGPDGEHKPQASAYFDAKAQQPVKGRFRMPLPFARVTSRFNPRRMHPVLHIPMPHNGCDFAAPPGTPVYAIAAGTVSFRGEAGPSGNLVQIRHDGDLESGYAHLSRFASGVHPGTHVEAKTLIGYSGSTGRSTGPHLHLSVKRHGVFIDPLTLKLDSMRAVPKAERSVFQQRRADADALLDRIEIGTRSPEATPGGPPPAASSSNTPSTAPSTSPSTAASTGTQDPAGELDDGNDEGPDLDLDNHSP